MKELLDKLLNEPQFEYIVAVMDTAVLDKVNPEMLQEGRWVPSKKKDWFLRIDPQNPQLKQQRHVHIARYEHINTKNMQVAWNQDGTKHDKATFNKNLRGIEIAKKNARDALDLPREVVLERATNVQQSSFLTESRTNVVRTAPVDPVLLIANIL